APLVDAATRLELAGAAFPDADVELESHPFTVDAVQGSRFENAVFILGADQAAVFHTWKEPEEVLRHVRLAVGTRAGYAEPDLSRYGDRVLRFQLDSPNVSSSEVRGRVAAGETIGDLVPSAVAELIERRGLYR